MKGRAGGVRAGAAGAAAMATLVGLALGLGGLATTGCPRRARPAPPPSGLGPEATLEEVAAHLRRARSALRTLRAVHEVTLYIEEKETVLSLSGFLAVQYPDRFRLRATAFGGVTLFDLLHLGGRTEVLAVHEKIEEKGPVALLWPELGRDLALALGLEPLPAYTSMEARPDRWVLRAPGSVTEIARPGGVVLREARAREGAEAASICARTVDYADHGAADGGLVVAGAMTVSNFVAKYRAEVVVTRAEPNVTLDPRLWARP